MKYPMPAVTVRGKFREYNADGGDLPHGSGQMPNSFRVFLWAWKNWLLDKLQSGR